MAESKKKKDYLDSEDRDDRSGPSEPHGFPIIDTGSFWS